MPVPKYRTSRSKRNMRRSHHALATPHKSVCPNCNAIKASHCVCPSCGHYKNRSVLSSEAVGTPDYSSGFDPQGDKDQ